jgi:uncharacterized protein (TIGR03435 family)
MVIHAGRAGRRPLLAAYLGLAVSIHAQTATEKEPPMAPDAHPGFLVATIRPSDPDSARPGWSCESEGHHIACVGVTLDDILSSAYGIHVKQIAGAPDWFNKDRYDINGVPDVPGIPNNKQVQQMYRKLLAERFHLDFHQETREVPIYAIKIANGGPLLTPADPKDTTNTGNSGSGGQRILNFRNISIPDFPLNMNFYEDRPVIDQTALRGRYNFTLKWTYDDSRASASDADAAPSLPTAMKEQLGLKFEAVKGPAPILVIDHVERPSAN